MPKGLRCAAVILLLISLAIQICPAQSSGPANTDESQYRAFTADGKQVSLSHIIDTFANADVVLVGESHNDAIAHKLEAEIFSRAFEQKELRGRGLALSLEMFERDVQLVLDEYLAGLISERHFLSGSRPWNNYQTDYRPMIEYARANTLPVIAANAPARYVSRVSSEGAKALNQLSKEAKRWLPPLSYAPASDAYATKFRSLMGENASHATSASNPHSALHLLDAQNLRDATMAFAITEHLKKHGDALVIHVNGKFHSEERLGIYEHIKRFRGKARIAVITILDGEDPTKFDTARLGRFGDFVILTVSKPASK
jgi:uncharacterized iron-regulated protein